MVSTVYVTAKGIESSGERPGGADDSLRTLPRLGVYPKARGAKGSDRALSGGYVLGGSSRRRPSTVLVGARVSAWVWLVEREGRARSRARMTAD